MLARARLLEAGHVEAPEDEADLHVVNTCCITREAEAKSRQSVRRSAHGREGRRVVVTGCAANLNAAQFDEIAPQVTALVGTADDVADEVAGVAGPGCVDVETDVLARQPLSATRTRGFVKVQDGCDCHCSYCIIPKVRGGARSRPASAVLEEVRRRVAQGQPEMVMTGISVGDYRDPERGLELGDLMREVAAVPGVERVRLSSVEVIHVRDSLLDALAEEPRICPHLHVPLQSGDDGVLASMGRNYDAAGYAEAIERLRARVPHVNVTTDVIVGYPTEDEAAFERTLDLVRATGITKVHTFSFSARPGTEADRLGDPVPPAEKKRRSRELRGLSEALGRRHRAAKLGATEDVLVDKVADAQVSGYSRDYTRWYLPAGAAPAGETVTARAEELYSDGLTALVPALGLDRAERRAERTHVEPVQLDRPGKEWSRPWGGVATQWSEMLLPRLRAFLPAGTILEIAPGYGRWTRYLLEQCDRLIGVDLAANCVEACRERFAEFAQASFHQNDGRSLEMVPDREIDLAVSIDSLVHCESDVLESYVNELARTLGPEGVAFIHHSNLAVYRHPETGKLPFPNEGWRGKSMSAELLDRFCADASLLCIGQETVNWLTEDALNDCFSVITRPGSSFAREPLVVQNAEFMAQAGSIAPAAALYDPEGFPGRPTRG